MSGDLGTRQRQTTLTKHPPGGSMTRTDYRDQGLTKTATASMTFTSTQITAAANTFANFAVGDRIDVQGTNLNNGYFAVLATDSSTYLTTDPAPKSEGPITATLRVP